MKEIIKNTKRTPYQTLATLIVLFFSSFILLTLFFTTLFFNAVLKKVEISPQVIIYFRPNTQEETISKLKNKIGQNFEIKSIKYVSQNEALKIYKSMFKDEPILTEMVSAEMLPPSLEIKVKNPKELYKIAEFAKKQPGVDEVDFQEEVVNKLLSITNTLRKTSIAVGSAIFLFTLIILISIISFKISLKKEEIEIQKFLGASNFFIYKPFLKENIFIAILSSILSFGIFLFILSYLKPFIDSFFWQGEDLIIRFLKITLTIWPINTSMLLIVGDTTILFSTFTAILATFISTKKYVK